MPLVDRLNDLLTRLRAAFERERTFSGDAAHELRTPLAGLRATAELALSRPRGSEEYRQALASCLDIVLHTQSLVDTLLELARLEGIQVPTTHEAIELAGLVDAAWRPFDTRAGTRQLYVERCVGDDLVVRGERSALGLGLGAVFANAVDHADHAGRVSIVATRRGNVVDLDVSNSGCTLSPGEATHAFERFWRGDAARSGTDSHHGLGLSLARRAVELAGGSVSVRVSDGIFTLHISLPGEPTAPG